MASMPLPSEPTTDELASLWAERFRMGYLLAFVFLCMALWKCPAVITALVHSVQDSDSTAVLLGKDSISPAELKAFKEARIAEIVGAARTAIAAPMLIFISWMFGHRRKKS